MFTYVFYVFMQGRVVIQIKYLANTFTIYTVYCTVYMVAIMGTFIIGSQIGLIEWKTIELDREI